MFSPSRARGEVNEDTLHWLSPDIEEALSGREFAKARHLISTSLEESYFPDEVLAEAHSLIASLYYAEESERSKGSKSAPVCRDVARHYKISLELNYVLNSHLMYLALLLFGNPAEPKAALESERFISGEVSRLVAAFFELANYMVSGSMPAYIDLAEQKEDPMVTWFLESLRESFSDDPIILDWAAKLDLRS